MKTHEGLFFHKHLTSRLYQNSKVENRQKDNFSHQRSVLGFGFVFRNKKILSFMFLILATTIRKRRRRIIESHFEID